ncbi:LOW QUALITY PROTEIN: Copia type Polyprotein [Phytophthora megakarya]|uniref:Copia type Polyprotein n=1 Tax=Phytophthora megakarya TaxID=4795 RepID=A0A225WI39_9STRA|nr:LOW QUALITY PROTEIN: Copia type Polyprotein [Phytophthora megakarya]
MTAQKVYRLQGELHRTRLRANGDSHLYKLFELKDRLEDLKSPVNDLQMVDLMLRSLPTKTCYNELRRKVFFSSNMGKYTPEMVREMVLTAESRSKDWENSAFGNNQGKKKPGSAAGALKGKMQTLSDDPKRKAASTDFSCRHCGGKGHYKINCPDLLGEEKPSGRKNVQAKYARSGAKPTDADDCTPKRKVVVGEAVKWAAKDYDPNQWYFDTGTNAHIVANKEYFTVPQSMKDSDGNPTISGFVDGVGAQAEGFGTILLTSMIDEKMVFGFVEDVLYVPSAGWNLFSPGLAMDQGFTMSWDQGSRIFGMEKDGIEVIRTTHEHRLWTFNAQKIGGRVTSKKKRAVQQQVVADFAVTDGVEAIDVWHEHLAHTCPEYICLMVDRGMAKGIMLKKRGKVDCADCHFGKQRRKTYRKKLDREVEWVNDLVFADLLIPGLQNGTQYIVEVNPRIQEYLAWAERQHGIRVDKEVTRELIVDAEEGDAVDSDALVRRVLTDKGQEFCNGAMERWYKKKGIVHTKVGPNASQLNPVERTHQTLIGMTVVYVKNRVFCKGAGCTPYELMFGAKPDIHHVRSFGSVTYCHTPVSKRKKLSVNCHIGFLIGYREDVVECYVYFPTEHKRGFVSDVKINEQIKYKDRYQKGFKMKVDKWLQTFDELNNLVDEDDDEDDASSQQAECDNNSVRSDPPSNVVMEDAGSEGIASSDQRVWDAMVRNSTPFDLEAVSTASEVQLPDYESDVAVPENEYGDAATEVEVDEDDRSAEPKEIESVTENPDEYKLGDGVNDDGECTRHVTDLVVVDTEDNGSYEVVIMTACLILVMNVKLGMKN